MGDTLCAMTVCYEDAFKVIHNEVSGIVQGIVSLL
jgi:hypothetical protein